MYRKAVYVTDIETTTSENSVVEDRRIWPERIASKILADPARVSVVPWGLVDYVEILERQEILRAQRRDDAIFDTWLLGQHPLVVTQGVRGADDDLLAAPSIGPLAGATIHQIDRGGQTTIHNPGQLVIYPIVKTQGGLLAQAWMSRALLSTVRGWIADQFGLTLEIIKGRPGLFHGGLKAAAIGISIRKRVSMHGIAINCTNDLAPWSGIIPCGEPDTRPVTLSQILGRSVNPDELIATFPNFLREWWGYTKLP